MQNCEGICHRHCFHAGILSRYVRTRTKFAADWVAASLDKLLIVKTVMAVVAGNGVRMLALTCLNHFVAGIVNGCGCGLISIKVPDYLFVSKLGPLPLTLIHVYLARAGCEGIYVPALRSAACKKERCFSLRVSISSCCLRSPCMVAERLQPLAAHRRNCKNVQRFWQDPPRRNSHAGK